MRLFKYFCLLTVFLAGFGQAQAALQIEITGGINEVQKIVVMPFDQSAAPNLRLDVASVVTADLMRSGKFAPLNRNAMPANATSGGKVNVDAFAAAGVQSVVTGKVTAQGNGTYAVEYLLTATLGENRGNVLMHRRRSNARDNQMRMAAHYVSDMVYETLLGQPGAFRTRIAYIVYRHGDRYPYQLMASDYDGYNETAILKSTEPVMTPNWSPDGRRLVYVSFERRSPAIYVQDVYTKKRTRLSSFQGLNSSPSWSPDGSKIAVTLSKDGNPEIYYYDLNAKNWVRVTSNSAIDTEPSWSSDSRSILFTSERGGQAQIYRYNLDNGQTSRITYQGAVNLSAKAIPGSNALIVITRANGYRVARVDSDGSLYMLTTSQLDETPSVSPNGSMIIYSTINQGRKGLALVSADGRFKANLPSSTQVEISSPAWGPIVN